MRGLTAIGLCLLVTTLGCNRQTPSPAPAAASGASSAASAASASAPLATGATAPDITFSLAGGEKLTLASLRGKNVVVYFYPKDDTPGCTIEAEEIRDLYEQIKKTNAVVVGVSTDSAESHRAFANKYSLPFYLASDESGDAARAFGVPLNNGHAARTSFVVSPDGHIKRVFAGVTPKGHAAELLTTLTP